jgi:WD40 repeat protein
VGCSLQLWDLRKRAAARELAGHEAPVRALAVSADGRFALSGGGGPHWEGGELVPGDCSVRLWDLAAGKEVGRFNGHKAPVLGMAFFPGGKAFASCGADGAVWLWEKARREGQRLPGGKAPAQCVAVSPSGEHVLSGSADGRLRLWEASTGQEVPRFPRRGTPVYAAAFSPDGRHVATAGGKVVELWRLADGKVERRLSGHTRPVVGVAFAPDGKTLLSGGLDGTVRLWDSTGRPVRVLEAPGGVLGVALAPGAALAAGRDGRVWYWALPGKS